MHELLRFPELLSEWLGLSRSDEFFMSKTPPCEILSQIRVYASESVGASDGLENYNQGFINKL